MRGTVRTILVASFGLLFVLDCSIANAANACNSVTISWSVTSKSGQALNAKQLAKKTSSLSYIAAIKAISNANNDVMILFTKKLRAMGMNADGAGYFALENHDPRFIDALRRKQKGIDQRMLDLITRHGLPVAEKVGLDGMMSTAMVMANTLDPADAAKFAELWKSGCAKGELPCAAYALIEDNALLLRDGVQRFGTSSGVPFANGARLVQVNEERAKVGLGPLSQTCMDSITRPHP
ncbi:hypothetical protein [Thiomonas sp.]|uniref:hypothetical protein n=1 Tax=Thiomonas sp. TaxID=2047785 RepID=UPI00258B37CF|nr:hypothetical protein [Thiomonas sp.]